MPAAMLPTIEPSVDVYGEGRGVLGGVTIAGDLGDQQAALFGQTAFEAGRAKNTYGTGCFLLLNTGSAPVASTHGLLTTVAYRIEGNRRCMRSRVRWRWPGQSCSGCATTSRSSDPQPRSRPSPHPSRTTAACTSCPHSPGFLLPYWRSDARGLITGLTRYAGVGHIARAALEATAFQTVDLIRAMEADSGVPMSTLFVDGGMVANELLMQFQADVLGVRVVRPSSARRPPSVRPSPPGWQLASSRASTRSARSG